MLCIFRALEVKSAHSRGYRRLISAVFTKFLTGLVIPACRFAAIHGSSEIYYTPRVHGQFKSVAPSMKLGRK